MNINYFNFFNEEASTAFVLVAGIIASGAFNINWLLIALVILFVIMTWFYRAPVIDMPHYKLQSTEVFSPAFGLVEAIEHTAGRYRIAIRLALWDIHIQYFPVAGTVYNQIRTPYTVLTAMKNLMSTEWEDATRDVIIVQRTGYVARRIATPEIRGPVSASQRLGMIKFGSHVDLELSDKYKLFIQVGDYVDGPYSHIGTWSA